MSVQPLIFCRDLLNNPDSVIFSIMLYFILINKFSCNIVQYLYPLTRFIVPSDEKHFLTIRP